MYILKINFFLFIKNFVNFKLFYDTKFNEIRNHITRLTSRTWSVFKH